jgi:hypothetical protein
MTDCQIVLIIEWQGNDLGRAHDFQNVCPSGLISRIAPQMQDSLCSTEHSLDVSGNQNIASSPALGRPPLPDHGPFSLGFLLASPSKQHLFFLPFMCCSTTLPNDGVADQTTGKTDLVIESYSVAGKTEPAWSENRSLARSILSVATARLPVLRFFGN